MGQALRGAVARQRILLRGLLSAPMERLAKYCCEVWPERTDLEQKLSEGLQSLPSCKFLFVLDQHARQITDNISSSGPAPEYLGRDRSERPYLRESIAGHLPETSRSIHLRPRRHSIIEASNYLHPSPNDLSFSALQHRLGCMGNSPTLKLASFRGEWLGQPSNLYQARFMFP